MFDHHFEVDFSGTGHGSPAFGARDERLCLFHHLKKRLARSLDVKRVRESYVKIDRKTAARAA